ncbi:PLP-dependent aminotransferase family protein [Amycolatopsis anabasis]|uniref:MocR-like pyridoxine biosynthesis transcription factor PdxR n=1 Tax=Amycolatopsis anabasis TaxID=1840409 RepID=UPI00131A963E|nr:PLP-dependent aminotransferase family protein [Amycolatopsis anabasis]
MAESWSSSSWDVHLDWQPSSGSRGLAEAIRQAIRDGRLAPGTAVPSTRALAKDLDVARGTVTRVYADLAAEGYLRTSQGAPTRVATAGAAPISPPRLRADAPEARWDLMPGRPDVSAFPRGAWLSATRRVLQDAPAQVFGYSDARGPVVLREALARYLARSRGVLADPERIVVCGGFSHGIALLSAVLRDLGVGEIAFEDPSLPQFRRLVADAGHRIPGIPVDDHGIRVSEVDSPAVVVTAAHQYPIGVTLAPDRRTALARLATEQGTIVIEDDYDGEFRFDGQQVGALQALAPERIVYVGTASKTLAPAMRVGWLVLPRSLVEPVRAKLASTGWRPPTLEHLVLAEFLESGEYDRQVRRCRSAYRARRDRLLAALPGYLTPKGIPAGLQALLMLPGFGPSEAQVMASARRNSVAFEPLGDYWIRAPDRPPGLVIGYATPAKHAFGPAIEALLKTLREADR